MSKSLKIGDTVKLKSGGPLMTVVAVNQRAEIDWCACRWFDDEYNSLSAEFPAASLKQNGK